MPSRCSVNIYWINEFVPMLVLSCQINFNIQFSDSLFLKKTWRTSRAGRASQVAQESTWEFSSTEFTCQGRRHKTLRFVPSVRKIPWRRKWQPTPVFLPGKFPWTEEPCGLQSMGSQRIRHDSATKEQQQRAENMLFIQTLSKQPDMLF